MEKNRVLSITLIHSASSFDVPGTEALTLRNSVFFAKKHVVAVTTRAGMFGRGIQCIQQVCQS